MKEGMKLCPYCAHKGYLTGPGKQPDDGEMIILYRNVIGIIMIMSD